MYHPGLAVCWGRAAVDRQQVYNNMHNCDLFDLQNVTTFQNKHLYLFTYLFTVTKIGTSRTELELPRKSRF